MIWGAVQAITLVAALIWAQPRASTPPFALAVIALVSIAYIYFGWRLREHAAGVRITAIILSAFALFSFPVGTILGIYGLWVLFKHRELAPR